MFGKSTLGSTEWYSPNDTKTGCLFYTSGETIGAIFAAFRNQEEWGSSQPIVRAILYDEVGNKIAETNEIQMGRTADDFIQKFRSFILPSLITLPEGYFRLTLQIGGYGAIMWLQDDYLQPISIRNNDTYADGASDPFEASDPEPPTVYYKEFSIYATTLEPAPPKAGFTFESPIVNKPSTFDASISTSGWSGTEPTTIVEYQWNWGDGSPIEVTASPAIQHTFTAIGVYQVTLTVVDNIGQIGALQYNITVRTAGEYYTWPIGFEIPEDAIFIQPGNTVEDQQKIQPYPFQSESSWAGEQNPNYVIERIPDPTGSGRGHVLRMALLGGETIGGLDARRIHIRHLWRPQIDRDLWIEAEVYIPPDFIIDSWTAILHYQSERVWSYGNSQMVQHQHGLGLIEAFQNPDGSYPLQTILTLSGSPSYITQGNVADAVDVTAPYLMSGTDVYRVTRDGLYLGQWNKIKTHAHRPLEDPFSYEKGYLEVWINDVKQPWYKAGTTTPAPEMDADLRLYDRMCGAHPDTIAALPPTVNPEAIPGGIGLARAWLEGGIDLYSGSPYSPKELLWDNVVLATTEPKPFNINFIVLAPFIIAGLYILYKKIR